MKTAVETIMSGEAKTAASEIGDALQGLIVWALRNFAHLALAAVILFVGVRLIRAMRKRVSRSMERAGMEVTLRKFLDVALYTASLVILVMIAAETVGIRTTSIVAGVGALGLAMGLAMQDTLANFAGGVLILFLKPFKVGDYIITDSGEGTVESIGLVYTMLTTIENRKITVPNNTVANSPITNTTNVKKRRLVLNVGIAYDSDLKLAKDVLRRLCVEHPEISDEDGVTVAVTELGAHGVNLTVRAWTGTERYWDTRWEMLENIKLAFDEAGIDITYNRLNVHVKELPQAETYGKDTDNDTEENAGEKKL